jgi:DNA-binding NtrC family response regulator
MKSKTILVACPDDSLTKSFPTFFHDLGYRVEVAQGLGELIRKVRQVNVHVVLLDDEIEGVKASAVVPLLRKNSRVQVIVISSEESLGSIRRLREVGIFYQAMKPVDLEEIRSAVTCALEKIDREHPAEGFFFFPIPGIVSA